MTDELQEYIEQHISEEPAHLAKLYRHTQLTRLYPRMCSGHIQGRMLKMLTQMISPMRVLELGTFTGYSALCMAEGMPEGAELHTVELDDEYADDIRSYFESAPCGGKITLHIGDALELGSCPARGTWCLSMPTNVSTANIIRLCYRWCPRADI